jgi:RHS repeat-associated protein
MAETDAAGQLGRSYIWGNDLNGSMQGAGGVGGLLGVLRDNTAYMVCSDANGNVMGLVNGTTGVLAARWDYDAFGNQVTNWAAQSGELCPFRFSTKYLDAESGWLYYGYRYYAPETGRWVSRDPIAEKGGTNLYGFIRNSPPNYVDPLGLEIAICLSPDVKEYLRNHGISGFDSTSVGLLKGAAQYCQELESEILGTMIKSDRRFEIIDGSLKNLKKHVRDRVRIVSYLKHFKPSFGNADMPGWEHSPSGGWTPSSGSWLDAINSIGCNPNAQTDCSTPIRLAFARAQAMGDKAVRDLYSTYFEHRVTNIRGDWVPGDWGVIHNNNRDGGVDPVSATENIVYLGAEQYFAAGIEWGHTLPVIEGEIADVWASKSGQTGIAPTLKATRYVPKAGIAK